MKIQESRLQQVAERWESTVDDYRKHMRYGQHLHVFLDLYKITSADRVHCDKLWQIESKDSVMVYLRQHDLIDYGN